jgi:hypothetical protein
MNAWAKMLPSSWTIRALLKRHEAAAHDAWPVASGGFASPFP